MTAALVLVLLVVVLSAFVLVDRKDARQRDERRELMNRVQRPELIPVAATRAPARVEPEPDELHLVGTIRAADAAAS